MALCLFAVLFITRLRQARHLGRLGYLGGRIRKIIFFCAVNILQLHQNESLSVFSTMKISF